MMKEKHADVSGKKKGVRLSKKIFTPMICLAFLQVLIFVVILAISGEFSYLKKFSYNSVAEKNENRKNYVEGMLNQVMLYTKDTANKVETIVSQILEEEGKEASCIASDKDLDKKIIAESAEDLVRLIRKGSVNDAFILLDSNGIYDENGIPRRTGLYIRDLDTNENNIPDNQDLLLEMGSSEVAHELGLALDFEWSLYTDISNEDDFRFFNETMEIGRTYNNLSMGQLGNWTGLSRISYSAQQSIKYTIPLIAEDGTVYGIIGIGLLEKTVQQSIPSNDFMNESACYIMAVDYDDNGIYTIIMHSGPAYGRLVKDGIEISQGRHDKYGIYDFSDSTKTECIGNIQDLNIHKSGSPYKYQRWVLISIADKEKTMEMYLTLIRVFAISLCCTLAVSIIFSIAIRHIINSPVKKMIRVMADNEETDEYVQFESSGIVEIDELASAIVSLQERIAENASSVSRIISMTGIGIGVFMYDIASNSIFVGESLIQMFDFDIRQDGDVRMSLEEFWCMMSAIDENNEIKNSIVFADEFTENNSSDSITISYMNKKADETRWVRFNMYRDASAVTGIAQDITKAVIEKRKIEYERDYDITTGLLNRRAFYCRMNILFSNREKLKTAACFMFDLDNLKYVNDTYGHDFGDDYIRAAAAVFRSFESEQNIVARLSGDEYIMFCYGYDGQDEINRLKNDILDKLYNSYCVLADGTHYKLRASGGISWYPKDACEYDLLIKYADFAMYTMKHASKGTIGEFDKQLYRNDAVLVTGIEELNRIIDEKDIKYAFQSIVSAKTGEIYGYELLMRPQSELLGTPLEFIRMARTDARLNEVEYLTWTLGLKAFSEQVEKGNINKNARIFLNTVPNNMLDDETIAYMEKEYCDCLSHIVLELLESEQTNDDLISKKKSLLVKWHGILALDDFGTGYNSEYALLKLNPNLIKIDRSLISGCDKDVIRANMIRDIVKMAKGNNIIVLAEGVETYEELRTVIKCGVDLLQGFYISKPLYEPVDLTEKQKQEIIEAAKED
ncbi:MAG: EAL domain-containing protein [Coprococcus sp.]